MRGGSWNNNPRNCRSTYRNRNDPHERNDNIGFRVVWSFGPALPETALFLIVPGIPAFTDAGSAVMEVLALFLSCRARVSGSRIYVTGPCGAGGEWSQWDSNPRPLACHASALPTELWPRSAYIVAWPAGAGKQIFRPFLLVGPAWGFILYGPGFGASFANLRLWPRY